MNQEDHSSYQEWTRRLMRYIPIVFLYVYGMHWFFFTLFGVLNLEARDIQEELIIRSPFLFLIFLFILFSIKKGRKKERAYIMYIPLINIAIFGIYDTINYATQALFFYVLERLSNKQSASKTLRKETTGENTSETEIKLIFWPIAVCILYMIYQLVQLYTKDMAMLSNIEGYLNSQITIILLFCSFVYSIILGIYSNKHRKIGTILLSILYCATYSFLFVAGYSPANTGMWGIHFIIPMILLPAGAGLGFLMLGIYSLSRIEKTVQK